MKKITVKKLYNGCASIRDYIVKDCLEKEKDLVIKYRHFVMVVPHTQLDNFFQFHKKNFSSKYNSKKYKLMDIMFIPDRSNNGISSF